MKKITFLALLVLALVACKKTSERLNESKSAGLANRSDAELVFDIIETKHRDFEKKFQEVPFNLDSIRKEYKSRKDSVSYLVKTDSILDLMLKEKASGSLKKLFARKERLEKNFRLEADEFNNTAYYQHKRWGRYWPNRKTLTATVSSQGNIWFKSNYFADDWLFHTSIKVLIDGQAFQSEIVETYEDRNKRDNKGGSIWEVITYSDSSILEKIAFNADKEIKVRFQGEFYNDITLANADKEALKDCLELSILIKRIRSIQ